MRVANCQASGEQAKDKEWLGACLVLHIIFDGVRDEVLPLEKELQATAHQLSVVP